MAGNNNEITTTFRADISQFSESISSLKRYISTVNSEFQVATKGSSNWAKSQDGLKAKITQLNRTLQAQEQIVAELEKEYDKVSKEQGENSEAAQKLTIEINKYRASIDKTKSSIEKYNKSLDEMDRSSKESETSLDDIKEAIDDLDTGFTVAKGAVAGFIANGLTALVGAAKNAVTSILGLAEATREYRQTLSTLDTAAEDVGVSTDYVRDKFVDMMGVFNDEDSVTEGLNNLLTAGFDEKSLDDITSSLEGAALKWKDTLKFEGMADSLQEWIGTGGESLTGQFAELLERMGYNLDDVKAKTAKMTEEQRRTYVTNLLAAEGLNTVSESYREQNAGMIEAQQANVNYQNTLATLGEKVEPITTKIREGFTRILDKMIELVEGVDLEAFAVKIEEAFTYFIDEILPAIVDGLQWILDNKDTIIAGVAGIGAAFLAWKVVGVIQGIIKAFKSWKLATEGMTLAQKALNLVMKANPIGIVISLIAGLVAAFVVLWNKSDAFRKFWQDLWENVKNIVKKAWSALTDGAKNAWNGIKSVFSKVGSFFSETFSKAWQKVKDIFSTGGKIFSGIKDGIASAFKTIVNGLIGGINTVVAVPFNAINKMLNKIRNVSILGAEPFKGFWKENPLAVPEIPKLARGGVVDKATLAMIGEAGKEAVVPLENNTQGLRKMAGMVAEELKQSGLGNMNVTYNNTFANMPTTRYAMKKAMADSKGMYQMLRAMQGGV